MHLVAGECRMALLQGPAQSQLRLGTAQPRNAKNRSPAEGKERKNNNN